MNEQYILHSLLFVFSGFFNRSYIFVSNDNDDDDHHDDHDDGDDGEGSDDEGEPVEIRIREPTGYLFNLVVYPTDKIVWVKRLVKKEATVSYPIAQQMLEYAGDYLEDTRTVADHRIEENSTILLKLGLCGGGAAFQSKFNIVFVYFKYYYYYFVIVFG